MITVYPQFSQQDAYNFCVKYDFNHDAIEEALGNIIDDSRHSFDAEWNTVAKNSKKVCLINFLLGKSRLRKVLLLKLLLHLNL